MNVLLLGADGFLGCYLQIALETAGHTVRRGVHRPVRRAEIAVDYARDVDPGAWRGRLTGVDAVINTVGILRESRGRRFDAIHDQAPRALFAACREAGVCRVIQVSALGADADVDLHPDTAPNEQIGLIFENPIRRFNELANGLG